MDVRISAGLLERLEERKLITTDPADAEMCCGLVRDEDGFCQHREHHPVYVEVSLPR